ncbi:unnamed protein product [Vitrella brassicaformis CCMP3155]|uniref:EF-hand domain-containing protein n=1 Tax=Vitrella brassicaformis (strain CCMP3155) TaxID=1169540 RepID=A0A0G4EJF0_VITBC|nr:unnamed protein product [Vitrella brassicaformis CCMP3155]|eukprot:CEL96874.1 unnamed protein product [Vitrella brassicaformis CCMP3155]
MDTGLLNRKELTDKQKKEIKAVFDHYDTSKDGKLSLPEMEKAMKKALEGDNVSPEEIAQIVDDLDENGDRELDYEEFFNAMKRKMLGLESEDDVLQAFQLIDKDKNGFISPPELRHLLTTLGRNPLTQDEVDELIHLADKDGDGLINFDEFFASLAGEKPGV